MAQQDISNVTVSIASLGITGITDSSGNCSFNVPPGTYDVKFEHNDFQTKTVSMTIGNSGSNQDVQLTRKSVEPETPTISTNGKAKVYIYEIGTESTWDERYAKPVSGILVNMHIDNPSYNQTKTTNSNGICLFENVPLEHSTDIINNALTIERQNGYRFYIAENDTIERTVFDAFVGDSDHYNDYNVQIRARTIPRKAYRLTGYVTPENNNSQAITGIKAQLISSDGTYNETMDVGNGMVADIQFDNVPIGTVTLKVNHINKNTNYKSYETTFTVTNDDAAMQTYWQNQGDGKSYTYEELGIAKLTYPVRLQLEAIASTTVNYTVNVKDAETNANLSGIPIIMYDPTTGGSSSTLISYSGTTDSSGSYTFNVEKNRNYDLDINFSPNIANPVVSGVFDYPDDKYALDCTSVNVGTTDSSYNSKIYHCKAKLFIHGVTYISQTNHNVVSDEPLGGVTVKIYDENQSTLLQTVTTGSDGYAIFKVEFGVTYKIVPSKSGYDAVTNSSDNKICLTYRRNSLEQQWKDGIFNPGGGIIQMITYQS